MAEQRLEELVNRLHAMTQQGKVTWEKTIEENEFQLAFPNYAVRITEDGEDHYQLKIYDQEGVLIERVHGFTDSGTQFFRSADANISAEKAMLLAATYTMARRGVLKVDEAIDNLLHALSV